MVMDFMIRGNKESYQITRKVIYQEIRLKWEYKQYDENPVLIFYDEINLIFPNRSTFHSYILQSKGASKEKLYLLSKKFNLKREFINLILSMGQLEIGLFKAILLIFEWVEVAYTDAYAVLIKDKIYNDFLVDYNSKPIVQEHIYFIKNKYCDQSYDVYLAKLIDLNLLVSATFYSSFGKYNTWFIPLIKPGVSRENFQSEFDHTGNRTYNLWMEILGDRDSKINSWFKNRF